MKKSWHVANYQRLPKLPKAFLLFRCRRYSWFSNFQIGRKKAAFNFLLVVIQVGTGYVKRVQIRNFVWSVFSRIRTEYGDLRVNLCIQFEYGNIRTSKLRIWILFTQWLNSERLMVIKVRNLFRIQSNIEMK